MGHVSAPGLDIALKNASLLQQAKVLQKSKRCLVPEGFGHARRKPLCSVFNAGI